MTEYPDIDKLNARQRLFCERYCTVWNQAKAAREAGYSEATAKEQAVRLLTNVNVQGYIKHIKDNAADFAGVSFLRNVQELSKLAYGSAADLRDSWENMKDWEDLPDDVKATIAEVTTTSRVVKTSLDEDKTIEIETVKVKQYDKRLAIEALNKMLGYNAAEKIAHSGGVEVTEKRMTFSDGSTRDENGNIIALPPALQPPD